jgi:heptosyltransferase-2
MRILVAQTSFLGDVVLSTPVFAALRRQYAEAHLTAMVRPESAGILLGHPHVDAVFVDDKRGRDGGFGSVRVLQRLRRERFDLVVALHRSLRTAVLLAMAGIPRRVGFRQSAGWFLYHRRVLRDARRHDVERNLSILAALDMDPESFVTRPFVPCSDEARARLRALLQEQGANPESDLVAIAPGSVWATKRWTVEGYAALLRSFEDRPGVTPILLGARGDAEYAAAVRRAAGAAGRGAGVDLVGKTDLPVLVAAIDGSRVLVTNDSAPQHIAVARGTPVVAIFGPTTTGQGFGPYTDRAVVVQRDLPCRPCSRHGSAECPIGTHACMRDIGVEEGRRAVDELLHRCGDVPRAGAAP